MNTQLLKVKSLDIYVLNNPLCFKKKDIKTESLFEIPV